MRENLGGICFVLLALAGCGGSDASSEAYAAAACPIDDAALCGRAAAAARRAGFGDAVRLVELSWKGQFADPRTELACGNVQPWDS